MTDQRPDPDALLRELKLKEETRTGKLKIFFGYAAGVGKTYAMLEAAHHAKEMGVDVVAGYIEPHVRPETLALLDGLEQLPNKEIPYKNITLREFDLDGALARKPQLILVDELAHTNAAGSRHTKRYQDIQELLEAYLGDAGYETATAGDGIEAVSRFQQEAFDLVLLDVMLPKLDGFGVCELIRRQSRVPIVLLTALDGEAEQLRGFDLEIDDYITKPFNPIEVIARVKSQLRRYTSLGGKQGGGEANPALLTNGGIALDDGAKSVTVDGEGVSLTPIEYNILLLLMKNPGRVFSTSQIYELVWNDPSLGSENTVAVHIRHLREKLEIDPANPRYIKVVWGLGYKMEKV